MTHIEKLIKECDEFKKEQIRKPKEQIYDNYNEIRFYEEIKEYLFSHLYYQYTEDDIKQLEKSLRNRSMSVLYDDFLKLEYSSIENWEKIEDFLNM